MTSVRVSACIVGGGPAGLMLGLLLAKRGADVLVLEGHQNFDREYRGEVLQPSTARLLDELGLLEYVLEQPHSILESGLVRLNGKEVGGFSFRRSPWAGANSGYDRAPQERNGLGDEPSTGGSTWRTNVSIGRATGQS